MRRSLNYRMRDLTALCGRLAGLFLLTAIPVSSALYAETFEYDDLGRLTKVTYDDGSIIEYTYDPAGNRTQQTISNVVPNQAPDAVDDAVTIVVDETRTIDPRTNDTDPESDPLTITASTNPTNGTAVLEHDIRFVYTPNSGYSGADSFTYTVDDGRGGTDTATISVTINVNQPPVANNDTMQVSYNVPTSFDPLTNDSDPENHLFTITQKTDGTNGTVAIGPGAVDVVYSPNANYSGADSFTYTIDDGHGGTDTATVDVTVLTQTESEEMIVVGGSNPIIVIVGSGS